MFLNQSVHEIRSGVTGKLLPSETSLRWPFEELQHLIRLGLIQIWKLTSQRDNLTLNEG